MNTFKRFLKIPGTYIGIVVALAFQLIFFCVWLTAYDGVYERADQIRIAIVNQDANMGSKIAQGLQNNLPFQVKKEKSMEKAKEEMDKHVYDMIIEIPASFSKDISEKGKADLNFHINQASAMMAKQMMEEAAKQVRDNVNKEVSSYKQQAVAGKLQAMEPRSAEAIKGLTEDSVGFTIHKVNDAKGFSVNMVPHVMLSHTYQTIGTLLPATYAADGYYTIIFGGESLTRNIMYLCMIIAVTQIIAVVGYKISISLKRNQAVIKGNEA
ncbi:ABC transporter permease [Bacillus sp. JJ864]|uniref:YhgE/Pip domain-containing protein n=1 Tax=Bacillus sp. JJ864 TaxID=3122975 RepID=UPI002FFF5255